MARRGTKELLLANNFVNSLRWSIVAPFLPLFEYSIVGESFLAYSSVNSIASLIAAFVAIFWAKLSDAAGRRKPFVIASYLSGVATSLMLSYVTDAWQLLWVKIAGSLIGSAGGASLSALIAKSFKKDRGKVIGIYNTLGLAGCVIGNLASGYFYKVFGIRFMLRVLAFTGLLPLIMILLINEEPEPRKEFKLKVLVSKPKIPREFWKIYVVQALLCLPSLLAGSFSAIYFMKYLNGSEELWALVASLTSLAGFSNIPYGFLVDKAGKRRVMLGAGLGWLLLYFSLWLCTDPIVFAIIYIIPVYPAFAIAYQALLMDLSDKCDRASLFATLGLISTFYSIVVSLIGGYLADTISIRNLYLIGALAEVVAVAVAYKLLPKNI